MIEGIHNVNLHAIGDQAVKFAIDPNGDCTILRITVGAVEVKLFIHDGKANEVVNDLEHCIRVYQMEAGE